MNDTNTSFACFYTYKQKRRYAPFRPECRPPIYADHAVSSVSGFSRWVGWEYYLSAPIDTLYGKNVGIRHSVRNMALGKFCILFTFGNIHNHFTAHWTMSKTTRVSWYQKLHFIIFWIFWCKINIAQADAPTIWMDCYPSRLIGAPSPPSTPFLCQMPFLAQPSQFIQAWDRHQICCLAYPVAWLLVSYKILFSSQWCPLST